MRDVWIRGVGLTRFGRHLARSGRDLAEEAVGAALREARLEPGDVQAADAHCSASAEARHA